MSSEKRPATMGCRFEGDGRYCEDPHCISHPAPQESEGEITGFDRIREAIETALHRHSPFDPYDDEKWMVDSMMEKLKAPTPQPQSAEEVVERCTRAVRNADDLHKDIGGSSRHWLRDCFLPELEKEGLAVTDATLIRTQGEEIERLDNQVSDGLNMTQHAEWERDQLQSRLQAANEERDTLRKFFETLARDTWDLLDFDGGDFQDGAEKLGLIVKVPADEQFMAEYDTDEMYVWAWNPLATGHSGEETNG